MTAGAQRAYQHIADELRARIREGALKPGEMFPSEAAIRPAAADSSGSGEAGGAESHGMKPSVYVATSNNVDATEQVRAAVQAGTPADPAAVMEATGLSLRQAKRALSQLN